ncbi:Target of EGR1, member 1 (Nuclear) [Dissophora globulifera]|nr:Target of EGR1, member 1 (Nuclear) [Dissophora globulifera]
MLVAAVPLPTYNQVTKHNLVQMQPLIVLLLKQAAFIALDAEFTGLGHNMAATRASDIQDRYQHLCGLARSHALVAFGLSIFIKDQSSSSASHTDRTDGTSSLQHVYNVHNFNFSMLSETDYAVSPRSMIFLAENGLDLNQWIMEGIPYSGGDRQANDGGRGNSNGIMRSIFKRIMTRQVPVVVHNGFLDLIFLYHSFYAALPPKLGTFVADLSDMFPAGLYDTKYISDYITRERSSFLAYLYRKYERDDLYARDSDDPSSLKKPFSTFKVQPRLSLPTVEDKVIPETELLEGQVAFCQDYAFHGVCKKNMRCGKSHDLDLILDAEEEQRDSKKRKKQKRRHDTTETGDGAEALSEKSEGASSEAPAITAGTNEAKTATTTAMPAPMTSIARTTENVVQPGEKFHSAYFDAFMTGTIFSHQLNQHTPELIEGQAKSKIYLIGKNFPLMVEKSAFSKYSAEHERQRAL